MERRPKEVWKAAMPLPEPVRLLHQAFAAAGHKLHVVGGAVRDFMVAQLRGLSFEPKDFDLVTAAVPDLVEAILRTGRAKRVLPRNIDIRTVGKAFGVILVSFRGAGDFEIATFREDGPGGGRKPDAVTFSTMPEDADRRDLTINALYYSIDDQEVIDFHGGIQHLRDNVVVFVGEPGQRLREDRLRALRFVPFTAGSTRAGRTASTRQPVPPSACVSCVPWCPTSASGTSSSRACSPCSMCRTS